MYIYLVIEYENNINRQSSRGSSVGLTAALDAIKMV
jgi:hypothetical protein